GPGGVLHPLAHPLAAARGRRVRRRLHRRARGGATRLHARAGARRRAGGGRARVVDRAGRRAVPRAHRDRRALRAHGIPQRAALSLAGRRHVAPVLGYASIAAVTIATVLIGFFGVRISRTTSDFYVASRTVRPWLNASAIGGEYLSAASVLGVAGLILLQGER